MTSETKTSTETFQLRLERLEITPKHDKRKESLLLAHEKGVDDETLRMLAKANLLNRKSHITLPAGRLEGLSRGRGWCRFRKGSDAEWGERVDGGYKVTHPGRWIVGHNDGFSRKKEDVWSVRHVSVGDEIWTIAD